LLGGAALGPVMELSALVIDDERPEGDRVAAGLILNDRSDDVPWIGDVFRRPEPRYAGLGGLLLRRMLAGASAAGLPEIGLAVTAENPAKLLYDRLGFLDLGVFTTVLLPGGADCPLREAGGAPPARRPPRGFRARGGGVRAAPPRGPPVAPARP